MAENGWNVSDALESAIPIASVSPLGQFRFTAFAQASLSWLEEHLETQTFYSTGLQVFTSLDVVLQDRTEKIFEDKLDFFMKSLRLPTNPGMQAGAVLIDPSNRLSQSHIRW